MSIKESIDELKERITGGLPRRKKQKIYLYSSGVSAKVEHANYSLLMLKELSSQSDASTSSYDETYTVSEKLHFYVDSFFAFLYSSYDVIAQVINQNMDLSIDEKKVSIKSAKRKIDSGYSGHQVASVLNRIFRSNSFKNLEKYRNCSTHRRQIYIRAETVVIEETPGYSTTGEITSVKRLLCDDPLALTPSVSQQRELVAYCENIFSRVCSDLIDISNNL